jgi:hypothetical protein
MRHRLSLLALALSAAVAAPVAHARDNLVKFDGAIGVHPVAGNSAAGAATTPNTVRGVAPGGRPWGILSFKATIKEDGSIRAKGEGLVLSGGDNAGSRGGVRQVAVTLFCGSNVGFNSPAADLSVGGDFEIRGALDAMPPSPCGDETTPATLLIRNATGGALGGWFAVGVVDD